MISGKKQDFFFFNFSLDSVKLDLKLQKINFIKFNITFNLIQEPIVIKPLLLTERKLGGCLTRIADRSLRSPPSLHSVTYCAILF